MNLTALITLLAAMVGPMAYGAEVRIIAEERRTQSPATTTMAFELPAVPEGNQVRLGLKGRIDWKILAGSNPWLLVTVNNDRLTGPTRVLLGGRPPLSETSVGGHPAHPTALAVFDDHAVGLAAEDDIFRIHVETFREPDAIGLRDRQLGIAPEGSHTLQWSIYPVPRGDYWDFINAEGNHVTSPYKYPVYLYLSTLENAYGKALMKAAEETLRVTGADGFYCDEFAWATEHYAYDTAWDGCTVTINPNTHALG
ncbi:MAG: hypothetical protein ABIK89_03940 [Planctomycetota bacterium]